MSKKVLILSGSPRKGGNSDILCDEFARGAMEAGHEVEKIRVAEKKIGYCRACYACRYRPLQDRPWQPIWYQILEKLRLCHSHLLVSFPIFLLTFGNQFRNQFGNQFDKKLDKKVKTQL